MADQKPGADRRQPFITIAGYQLWDGVPWATTEGSKRWTYGPHTPNFDLIHTSGGNAEIVKPFPEEEKYFVSYGRQRGWISGGMMDAICLALTFLENKGTTE